MAIRIYIGTPSETTKRWLLDHYDTTEIDETVTTIIYAGGHQETKTIEDGVMYVSSITTSGYSNSDIRIIKAAQNVTRIDSAIFSDLTGLTTIYCSNTCIIGSSMGSSGGSGDPQNNYTLQTVVLQTSGSGLSCQLSNYTITTIGISDISKTVYVHLPAYTENDLVRDFMVRFENTGSDNASVAFVPPDGESIDFEGEDDDWATIEPGVNLVSFTETKRS